MNTKQDRLKIFSEKLKQIIDNQFGRRKINLCRAADISPNTLQNYLKGDTEPGSENLAKLAKAIGISKDELYPNPEKSTAAKEPIEVSKYEGPERRKNWPYTSVEQNYIEMLIAILRGKNEYNKNAIKENIKAFYASRDYEIEEHIKKQQAG